MRLLLRSFARAQSANLGSDATNVYSVRIALPPNAYDTEQQRRAFSDRLRACAARREVGGSRDQLAAQHRLADELRRVRSPDPGRGNQPHAEMNIVSDDYFRTLQIPLLRGRGFGPADTATAPVGAVVDQAFVDRFFALRIHRANR